MHPGAREVQAAAAAAAEPRAAVVAVVQATELAVQVAVAAPEVSPLASCTRVLLRRRVK